MFIILYLFVINRIVYQPIKRMLERQMPMLPALNFNIVDVRDVALAHVRAMTLPEAAGRLL